MTELLTLSPRVKVPKSDEEYDLRVPRDMAYIFSGAYVPLSCKLVEQVLERDSWAGLEEVTRLLNGHEFAAAGAIICGRMCRFRVTEVGRTDAFVSILG